MIIDSLEIERDEDVIIEYVDKSLKSALAYPDRKRRGSMRGATLANQCFRINTFLLSDEESPGMSGYSVIATESGKAVEDIIVGNMLRNDIGNIELCNEFIPKVNKMGLNYSGKLDLMMNVPGVGYVVVDLKTTQRIGDEKRFNIEALKEGIDKGLSSDDLLKNVEASKGGIRRSPMKMEGYVAQVVGYATFLDIDYGLVYVFSRSKESWNEPVTTTYELVKVTDEMKYAVITQMLLAQRCDNQYALPAKPKNYKKTTTCKYCKYAEICYDDQNGDYTFLSDDDTNQLYFEIYPEAVELYEKYRGTLAWIRDKKIEDSKIVKEALSNPTPENIAEVLKSNQIHSHTLLRSLISMYDMKTAVQFMADVNVFI